MINGCCSLLSLSQETTWSFVRTPLKMLKPTEFEFIAMCGYLLWTPPGNILLKDLPCTIFFEITFLS